MNSIPPWLFVLWLHHELYQGIQDKFIQHSWNMEQNFVDLITGQIYKAFRTLGNPEEQDLQSLVDKAGKVMRNVQVFETPKGAKRRRHRAGRKASMLALPCDGILFFWQPE